MDFEATLCSSTSSTILNQNQFREIPSCYSNSRGTDGWRKKLNDDFQDLGRFIAAHQNRVLEISKEDSNQGEMSVLRMKWNGPRPNKVLFQGLERYLATHKKTITSHRNRIRIISREVSNPEGNDESRKKFKWHVDEDPFEGLGRVITNDTVALFLKWEQSVDHGNSRLVVGDSHCTSPFVCGGFCLNVPKRHLTQGSSSLPSPLKEHQNNNSTRELLFRLVLQIVILSPYIQRLHLVGFGGNGGKHKSSHDALDIEDVFEAFAREELSTWRNGFLGYLTLSDCDMNSHNGNHFFNLAEHEYPEGLEKITVFRPRGNVISSSIFRIASKSIKFNRFDVSLCGKTDNSNTGNTASNNRSRPHRLNGHRLTQTSMDAICEVFSSTNQLLDMNHLPCRELFQLPEAEFNRVLEATTISRIELARQLSHNQLTRRNLQFPTMTGAKMASKFTIVSNRFDTLRYYLLRKRCLEVLRNPDKRGLSPLVLEKCQEWKKFRQAIRYNHTDLLFAMLKDSLEGMLASTMGQQRLP